MRLPAGVRLSKSFLSDARKGTKRANTFNGTAAESYSFVPLLPEHVICACLLPSNPGVLPPCVCGDASQLQQRDFGEKLLPPHILLCSKEEGHGRALTCEICLAPTSDI